MTPDAPRHRRAGWPWPPAHPSPDEQVELRATEALVHSTALAVARLTEELRLALLQLEQAQAEAHVAAECVAARAAGRAIARARQRHD